MESTVAKPLAEFLTQKNIEASPAWEFINGVACQKVMPTLFHSRLQRNLVNWINQNTDRYEAIQALRCIVPPISPVPDIAVLVVDLLPQTDGPFAAAPDWLIEIRSPDQSMLDLQNKILHCLSNGTELAWLIDIQRQQIWVWQAEELPMVYNDTDNLPGLTGLPQLQVAAVIAMTQQR
ncbi:Uma2 family endonuclease [filamentous cyanobacterium LEGE 11480]|uniref:Uma2 family endonuclease n=1 Tax=Romeriopsis navalis LEGE 11480 TaxID=2777977 RepID=A0A928VVA9_9CYAN|nr:Uma2 family endonuclease [Romeriopsis navalis LEGE 11480]